MRKVGIISLGCVKNLVDAELMLGDLASHELTITPDPEEADIIIVNTCGFIESAQQESVDTILQMAEYKNSNCKMLLVSGCLAQRFSTELITEIPEIDAIIGTGSWQKIREAIERVDSGEKQVMILDELTNLYTEDMPRVLTTPSYTAYIKVAEGCSNRCAYCVIPSVRGDFRSRPMESIIAEAKNLAEQGVREINLIAQDTTNYGTDLYGERRITALLRELVKIEKIEWIRLLYCYPHNFTDDLIELMATEPKVCSYVDLPLQHISDTVLRRMNRRDTKADIEKLLKKIRERIEGVVIRSSFIVGFPGETEADFEELKEFIETQKFERVGIFTYSREAGTPAYDMEDQIPEEVKEDRYHTLMATQCVISEAINQSYEGEELTVLVEGKDSEQEGLAYGRSYREAPDIDGKIFIENEPDPAIGTFIQTEVIQGFTYDLVVEKIDE
ncbi:MAG: 30S ribosomal protein S12 methylthiotransferase RimO [Selenomonadales bacterium]|nr:30S ribosomal protein S12 methylthiotransferase RimO [Selenomonadales bacterium]MBR0324664.1 30S ribosomal protein S12 methylthiotransferase RimO [Selenomonadales bacterium]